MSTSFFSFIFAGLASSGVLVGTLQQNFSEKRTEIDKLFDEIVEQIKKFSIENPIDEKTLKEIKKVPSESKDEEIVIEENGEKSYKNTFNAWTNFWIGFLDQYIAQSWVKNGSKKYSDWIIIKEEDKEENLKKTENSISNDKKQLEDAFPRLKQEIQKIYEKIKEFVLLNNIPPSYSSSGDGYTPYESHIKELSEVSKF